jgi:uncharacterized UPF0146 family protein
MVSAWVLIVSIGLGSPFAVSNIVNSQACDRLAEDIQAKSDARITWRCLPYQSSPMPLASK